MIVLDTSVLVGYAFSRDAHHKGARDVVRRVLDGEWGQPLLLEHVFVETTTVLAVRQDQAGAVAFGNTLLSTDALEWVPASAVFESAWETFKAQPSARWSFTDAAIVAVARSRGAPYVASFDTDFAGVDGITLVPSPQRRKAAR